ncbi:hypothetical protein Tco_0503403 [Tanacetum coccineum]
MELFCFVDDVFDSEYVQVQVMVQQVQNWKHVYASKGEFVWVSLPENCKTRWFATIPCDLNKDDDSKQQISQESDDDIEYDPSVQSLLHGDDEVELTDEESSNSDDEEEVVGIFRIETNVFDFETPLCRTFKEFNYLLQIDLDILTKDIKGFKTYEEYKDDWIYDGYSEWPTCSWREDGYFNGGNLPGTYIVGNTICYQDLEWYDALKDSELKDEALRNKAIMEGLIDEDDESSNNGWRRWDGYEIADHDQEEREYENRHKDKERCELFNDHELSVCNIRRSR